MKASVAFGVLVFTLLGIAVATLSPRGDERIAILLDKHRFSEAAAALEKKIKADPGDQAAQRALAQAYAGLGEYDHAASLFDKYLADHPDDVAAREMLAEALRKLGASERHIAELSRVVAAQPTGARVGALADAYRDAGRSQDELALLRAHSEPDFLSLTHAARLGQLLADGNELDAARQLLEGIDARAPLALSEPRLVLLDVLVRLGRTDEAATKAAAWLQSWKTPYLATGVLTRLARSQTRTKAYEVARLCANALPDNVFDIAGQLTADGYGDVSREMLIQWSETHPNPRGPQLKTFMFAASQIGDAALPFRMFTRLVNMGKDPAAEAQMAEEIAAVFGMTALEPLRPMLSFDALLARPLFAAELMVYEQSLELARWYLAQADPSQLDSDGLTTWLTLSQRLEPRATTFERMVKLWRAGTLPVELLRPLANEALSLGDYRTHDLVLHSMSRLESTQEH